MCGTSNIDHNFFPDLIVSIMVAFMNPQISYYWRWWWWWWMVINWSFSLLNLFFLFLFLFLFLRYPNIPKDDWLQLFQIKLFWRLPCEEQRYINKLLLYSFFDKPFFTQSLQLIPCKCWGKFYITVNKF